MPTSIEVRHKTICSVGGGPGTFVAWHLNARMPDFGPPIGELELTLSYNTWDGPPLLFDTDDPNWLKTRNSRRFERKRRILRGTWLAVHAPTVEVARVSLPQMTRALFDQSFDDIIDAAGYGMDGLKRSDDFDGPGFLAWLAEVRAEQRPDGEDLRALIGEALDVRKAKFEALTPWDRLSLDWSRFAPKARDVLDDPDDWSEGYDFAPHGNDTGADIFSQWSRFSRLTPEAATRRLEAEVPGGPEDENDWFHRVQVHLALAFGHIKKTGTCPGPLRTEALVVLETERTAADTRTGWEHREEWLGRLDRYIRGLRSL